MIMWPCFLNSLGSRGFLINGGLAATHLDSDQSWDCLWHESSVLHFVEYRSEYS